MGGGGGGGGGGEMNHLNKMHIICSQVEYGQLSVCFVETKQLGEYCILQHYEGVLCGDKQLRNEKECPFLFHTKALAIIPASSTAQQFPFST